MFSTILLKELTALLRSPKFGDEVELSSQVTEFRRSSFDVEHKLTIGGELAVDGGETRVWAARDRDDPEKISGIAIPKEVVGRFG